MFEKVPYGVKARVRGNEKDGFVAEYAICTYRFLPFMDKWNIIQHYPSANPGYSSPTFPTFELAKEAAMTKYDSWMNFYICPLNLCSIRMRKKKHGLQNHNVRLFGSIHNG
jgi:hypothetical protein